ncbi:hypothetical protein P9230_19405 [Mesorhizobium sp. WSM4887]|nr:hypothetical protein [Mesorhizobium sp. WSM4887]
MLKDIAASVPMRTTPRFSSLIFLRRHDQIARAMKGLADLAVEQQALLGRNQPTVRSIEQAEAGVDLQLLQQPADARLRDVERDRSARHGAGHHRCLEGLQLTNAEPGKTHLFLPV